MNENRRKFIRIDAGRAPCQIEIGGVRSDGYLINESIYGVCVGGLDLMFLGADQQVLIESENERIVGRCRSASKEGDGKFQIGILKSEDNSEYGINRILINSYIEFGGARIVCIPLGRQPRDLVQIRLIDGKEFTVSRSKVVQMTRSERQNELNQDVSTLGRLLKIYAALTDDRSWHSVNEVLVQEFGPRVPEPVLARS